MILHNPRCPSCNSSQTHEVASGWMCRNCGRSFELWVRVKRGGSGVIVPRSYLKDRAFGPLPRKP